MLDCIQHADFTRISPTVYANFHADCDAEFPSVILAKSLYNLCGILAESLRNLCGIDLCLIHA